jgi:hypothetical protein
VQVQSPNSTIPNSGKININQSGIDNRQPIGQEPKKPSETYLVVDMLLEDYKDLIDPNYVKWFAKRFYTLPFDLIHASAQEARQAKDPMRLFSFIINRKYNQMTIKKRYQDLQAGVAEV